MANTHSGIPLSGATKMAEGVWSTFSEAVLFPPSDLLDRIFGGKLGRP